MSEQQGASAELPPQQPPAGPGRWDPGQQAAPPGPPPAGPWPPPATLAGSPPVGPPHWGQQPWPPPYGNAAPARPARPAFPHAEPQPYHLMLRTWNYAWWRPVVGILTTVFGLLVVAPFVMLPVLALAVALEGGPFAEKFQNAVTLKVVDPAALLYLNLVLGSMILVTWAVVRVVHQMRPRWLASVRPKIRWRFLFACMGLAVLALVAQLVVGRFVPGGQQDAAGKVNSFSLSTLAVVLVVALTTPLQAAGEEYVFRGYLMQAFGAMFTNKWAAILITSALFAAAHGVQNIPLFFDRFMFGFIAGWLVTRTGGLEAGIAMHILNNFLAYGFALAFGNLTASLTVSEVSWWNIPLTLTQSGAYAVLVLWLARRMDVQTRTRPPGSTPADPPPGVPSPVP